MNKQKQEKSRSRQKKLKMGGWAKLYTSGRGWYVEWEDHLCHKNKRWFTNWEQALGYYDSL